MSPAIPECTVKCRSTQHADEVVAVLTCCSEKHLQAFLSAHCYNAATLKDAFGRTALHLAASTGKKALLEWLVESKNADLLAKDKESGWTPLHRSVFYGQIHCLMALVKVGALLNGVGGNGRGQEIAPQPQQCNQRYRLLCLSRVFHIVYFKKVA